MAGIDATARIGAETPLSELYFLAINCKQTSSQSFHHFVGDPSISSIRRLVVMLRREYRPRDSIRERCAE
jgi:hypothetical protein